MKAPEATVRELFSAYRNKDRDAADSLLAPSLRFKSPYGVLDREGYFEHCWPHSQTMPPIRLEAVTSDGQKVFVLYEFDGEDGGPAVRNMEAFIVEGGQVRSIEVFFGNPCEPGAE